MVQDSAASAVNASKRDPEGSRRAPAARRGRMVPGWNQGSHRQFKHPVKPGRVTVPGRPVDETGTRNVAQDLPTSGMDVMKYAVVIEPAGTGYSAYVPDLPGCIPTGPTLGEVESGIAEAITLHLQGCALTVIRFLNRGRSPR